MKKLLVNLTLALLPAITLAAGPNPLPTDPVPGGAYGALAAMRSIANWMFSILLVLSVIFILYAAFIYLTSSGDTEKAGKAHQILIYAAIAIVVAILSRGIVYAVSSIVGYNATPNYGAGLNFNNPFW